MLRKLIDHPKLLVITTALILMAIFEVIGAFASVRFTVNLFK